MRKDIIKKCKTCKEVCYDLLNGTQCEIYEAHSKGYHLGMAEKQKEIEHRYKWEIQIGDAIKNMILEQEEN